MSTTPSSGNGASGAIAVGVGAGVAALLSLMSAAQISPDRALQLFNQLTTPAHSTISVTPRVDAFTTNGINLFSAGAPSERSMTVPKSVVDSAVGTPGYSDSASVDIAVTPGASPDQDRFVLIAPEGQTPEGLAAVQTIAVRKGQRMTYTAAPAAGASYIPILNANGSPTFASINAMNAQRDYLNLIKNDSSWGAPGISLAQAANKNVTAN